MTRPPNPKGPTMLHRLTKLAAAALIAIAAAACGSNIDVDPSPDTSTTSPNPADTDSVGATSDVPTVTLPHVPINNAPVIAALPVGEELPAIIAPEFECQPEKVGAEMQVSKVVGGPNSAVFIRPTRGAECQFELVYRDPDGSEHIITGERDGGYLFTSAVRTQDTTVICTNNIHHTALAAGMRHIDSVVIECAAHTPDGWTELTPVVIPDGPWAAWIRSLEAVPDSRDTFRLRYARDFSFNFFNLTDNGRPSSDGLSTLR